MLRVSGSERVFFVALLFTISAIVCSGQSLYLLNIDTSAFPRLSADYVAIDDTGAKYTNLSAQDFAVVEHRGGMKAVDVSATVTQGCTVVTDSDPSNILLIVDESGSMAMEINGIERFELMKRAVIDYVHQLNISAGTQVCIIGFAGTPRMICPWSGSLPTVLTAIEGIGPFGVVGGTVYEGPFLESPNIFDEFKKAPSSGHNSAILITDLSGFPTEQDFLDTVRTRAIRQGIALFSVTIAAEGTSPSLAELCESTGGQSFTGMDDSWQLLLAEVHKATRKVLRCHIEWTTKYVCDGHHGGRIAVVTLLRGRKPIDSVEYTASDALVEEISSGMPVLDMGRPPANGTSEALLTLTANSDSVLISGHTISPSSYFSVVDWNYPNAVSSPPSPLHPITIRGDVPHFIQIQMHQDQVSNVRSAMLQLVTDGCDFVQVLRGGGGGVVVVTPNGREVLTTCDTVDIAWSGVPIDAPVHIQWSLDGLNWNDVALAATRLHYRWLPPEEGQTYRIRIRYAQANDYTWVRQIGNSGNDTASSIAVSRGGDRAYVTGWFKDASQFGASPVSLPRGAIDGFCQEFDSDGAWGRTILLTGSSDKNEKIIGGVVDAGGNLYIAGFYESSVARISNGTSTITLHTPKGQLNTPRDASNIVIAKISRSGVVEWVRVGQGTAQSAADVSAGRIGINEDIRGQTRIVVEGVFSNCLSINTADEVELQKLGPNLPKAPYHVVFDGLGNVVELLNTDAPPLYQFSTLTGSDISACTFEAAHFMGKVSRGSYAVTSRGDGTNICVARRCESPASEDMSDTTFVVDSPSLAIVDSMLNCDTAVVGVAVGKVFRQVVCNPGENSVRIEKVEITGANASDFALITAGAGKQVPPYSCVDLDIRFSPSATGSRSATLNIVGECGILLDPTLTGVGVEDQEVSAVIPDLDWFTRIVGTQHDSVMYLINTCPQDVRVESIALGTVAGDIVPDFTSAPSMPRMLAVGDSMSIPVTFSPTFTGNHSLEVIATIAGSSTVIRGTARGVGVGASDVLPPVNFEHTFACDTSSTLFWLHNTRALPLTITSFEESDPNDAFTLLAQLPVTIAPNDSLQMRMQFAPPSMQSHRASYRFLNTGSSEVYVNVSGEGITTAIEALFGTTSTAVAGGRTQIPVRIHRYEPYYKPFRQVTVVLRYPPKSLYYDGFAVVSNTARVVSMNSDVSGELVLTIDPITPDEQDVALIFDFNVLLAADSIAVLQSSLTTGIECVIPIVQEVALVVDRSCAGISRVVNSGAHTFMLGQIYPNPAADALTILYATGYDTSTRFEIIDALTATVHSVNLGVQPSAAYDVEVPVADLPSGTYLLRMTSGHYVESKRFSVVR